jgi:hypothetical protein
MTGGDAAVFLFFTDSNKWFVSDAKAMHHSKCGAEGRARGWLCTVDEEPGALTPNEVKAGGWQIANTTSSGSGWLVVPKLRCRAHIDPETRLMGEQLRVHTKAGAIEGEVVGFQKGTLLGAGPSRHTVRFAGGREEKLVLLRRDKATGRENGGCSFDVLSGGSSGGGGGGGCGCGGGGGGGSGGPGGTREREERRGREELESWARLQLNSLYTAYNPKKVCRAQGCAALNCAALRCAVRCAGRCYCAALRTAYDARRPRRRPSPVSKPSPHHRSLLRSCPHLPALRPARLPCSPQVSDVERLLRKYAAELPQVRGCPACCTARRPALAAKARAATSAPPPLRAAANTNGGRSIPHRTISTTDTAVRCCCGCPCRLAVSSRLCGARRAAGRALSLSVCFSLCTHHSALPLTHSLNHKHC